MNENTIPHTVEHLLQLLQTITRTEHLSFTVEQDRLMIPDFGTSFNIINLDAYSTGEIHHRLQQSRLNMGRSNTDSIPLLCVPFMKEAGKIICQEEQMSWFDLSGNAHITTNTLHIFIEGKANKYPDIGRPSNLFASKSSRIVRWLMMYPNKPWTQRLLSQHTGVSEGFVSRIVKGLLNEHYIIKHNRKIQVSHPTMVLQAWKEAYDFDHHTIIKGHIPARNMEQLTKRLQQILSNIDIQYALSGLAGAWMISPFAQYQTTTCYISQVPNQHLLQELGFRQTNLGANMWFVIPDDEGIWEGVTPLTELAIPTVHPFQVWLDLKAHPERADEASEVIFQHILREYFDDT